MCALCVPCPFHIRCDGMAWHVSFDDVDVISALCVSVFFCVSVCCVVVVVVLCLLFVCVCVLYLPVALVYLCN